MKIAITEEMRQQARIESKRRDAHIRHHFNVNHLSNIERDELGFLGEFACCKLLNIDWKENIRKDYFTIDNFDFKINGLKADVKTETVPLKYAKKIINKSILDNDAFGRRLINENQFDLLPKYDIVIFGMFIREMLDYWYPIGYIETSNIVKNYPPTESKPYGGKYPFPGSPVPISVLKSVKKLIDFY